MRRSGPTTSPGTIACAMPSIPPGTNGASPGPAGEPVAVRVTGSFLTNSAEALRALALDRIGPVSGAELYRRRRSPERSARERSLRITARSSSRSTPSTRTAIISRPKSESSSICWLSGLPNIENGSIRTPPSEPGVTPTATTLRDVTSAIECSRARPWSHRAAPQPAVLRHSHRHPGARVHLRPDHSHRICAPAGD